jgi:hypothetical protein
MCAFACMTTTTMCSHRRQEKERKRTDEDIVAGIEYRHRYVYNSLLNSASCVQLHAQQCTELVSKHTWYTGDTYIA